MAPNFDVIIAPAAILPDVTCNAPRCILSILPLTNSDESTEFAASRSATIVPEGICVAVTELLASSLVPTAFSAIFAATTELAASLSDVICKFATCIVSILPLTNSDESTEFKAISLVPIALAAMCLATTELLASCPEVTLLLAIFDVIICPVPMCILSILPLTNSDESTELAAIAAASIALSPTAVTAAPCNCAAPTALVAICRVSTALSAISDEPTALAAISLAVIELLTISVDPTAFASSVETSALTFPMSDILCLLQI